MRKGSLLGPILQNETGLLGTLRIRCSRLGYWLLVLTGVTLLAIPPLWLWTRTQTVRVTEHHWRQEIRIDRFGPVATASWCHQLAPGALGVIRRAETGVYRWLPDAEDCHGLNRPAAPGATQLIRDCRGRLWTEPAYEMRCDYQFDRWMPYRTVVAEGYSLQPDWPESGMISAQPCTGCERESTRSGQYELILSVENQKGLLHCPLPLERWLKVHPGSLWRLDIGMMDGQPRCSSLAPIT